MYYILYSNAETSFNVKRREPSKIKKKKYLKNSDVILSYINVEIAIINNILTIITGSA